MGYNAKMGHARVLLVAACLLPGLAYAALPPGVTKVKCTTDQQLTVDLSKGCYQGNKNICFDEKVTFTGVTIEDKLTCICKTNDDFSKVGCGTGFTAAGKVTTEISGNVESKSKCDPHSTDELKQLQNQCKAVGGATKCVVASDSTLTGLIPKGCDAGVPLGGPQIDCNKNTPRSAIANSTALAQGCAYASDVATKLSNLPGGSLQDAKVVIGVCSNNSSQCTDNCPGVNCPVSQAVQAAFDKGASSVYVNGVGSGVTNSAQVNQVLDQVAKDTGATFLGAPNSASLNPDGIHYKDYSSILQEVGQIEPSGAEPDTSLARAGAPNDYYSGICNIESRCGQVATPANRDYCAAQGDGQYICGTWTKYANESGHSDLADPSNRFDKDAVRLVTNDWYKNVWEPKNAGACAAANLDLNTCSFFNHWNGNMAFVNALPGLDPSASVKTLCGAGGMLTACESNPSLIYQDPKTRQNPYTIGGLVQNISNNVGAAGSFASTVPPPAIAGKDITQDIADITRNGYTASPSISSGSTGFGSMFNNPFLGYGLGSSLMNPFSNLFKPANASPYQQQVNTTPPPPAPTLSLTVQPLTLKRGNSITVSWTSSGMSVSAPCTVTKNGASLGSGNAGAVIVTTSSTSTASSIIFRLVCQGATNGQVFQQSSTAVFQ